MPGKTQALQSFMTALIDYAGLFPPATLSLDAAMVNYLRYRDEPDAWMLGRFVLPATQVANLRPEWLRAPLSVSLLGQGGASVAAWLAQLHDDLAAVRHVTNLVVDVFEVKLPTTLVDECDSATLPQTLQEAALSLDATQPFYEVPSTAAFIAQSNAVIGAIAEANVGAGYKLRCGGVEASMIPSTATIAQVLVACRDAGVPLKCTAGLHHPLRRYSVDVDAVMHGFVNVFGAGMLAYAHGLDSATTQAILDEQDAAAFVFDDGFRWRDFAITDDQIAALRAAQLVSFGSCSFDEPLEDMRALGWRV